MLRIATLADLALLNTMNKQIQDTHHALRPDIFKPGVDSDMRETLRNFLTQADFEVWLASTEAGEPAGYIALQHERIPETDYAYAAEFIHLHHIGVDPQFQGQGIASALLKKLTERAQARKVKEIQLSVWAQNSPAIRLFSGFGFRNFKQKMVLFLEE